MQKLSITTAWNESAEFLKGNFGALFTVALAFMALPSVAMQALGPGQLRPGDTPPTGLWMLLVPIVIVLSIVGTLAISSLALRRENVIGAAIAHGFRRFLPMLGATLLIAVGLCIVVVPIVLALGLNPESLRNPTPGAAGGLLLAFLLIAIIVIAVWVKLMLMTPVAAAERVGPIGIIRRSWGLTRGHFWKLLGFVILMIIVLLVVGMVVGLLFGLLVAAVAGAPEPGSLAGLLLLLASALVNAAFGVVLTTMVARIYVQLAGEPTTGS